MDDYDTSSSLHSTSSTVTLSVESDQASLFQSIATGLSRMEIAPLLQQRYCFADDESNSYKFLFAKLEKALDRRMTGQDFEVPGRMMKK